MKMTVYSFTWEQGLKYFSWSYEGRRQERRFEFVPRSIIMLEDRSGFAVVGACDEYGKDNAFILNGDGSVRFHLAIPNTIADALCFHEIYYTQGELTAIIGTRSVDFACVIDSDKGTCKRIYETR